MAVSDTIRYRFLRSQKSGFRSVAAFLLASIFLLAVFSTAVLAQSADSRPADLSAANADPEDEELARSTERWTHSIETSLVAEKFTDLDQMADQYRREKTRLLGGEWRLRLLYKALDAPHKTDQDTRDHLAHLQHWVEQRPDSVTARIALARSLHRWAWVARGHSYADKVTPQGWRLFNERMKQSQTTLETAANMSPMCPQWFSEMMAVGLAQSWSADRMQEVFDRGIRFEPGYYYLYLQYANYLLPKWDGHAGDASAFAKSSADALGGPAGDLLYFQIATVLIVRGDGSFPVREMEWERLQRGYRALTSQYGVSHRDMNQLAFMAFKFKDATTARKQFETIGDRWSPAVWGHRELFDRARDWSRDHSS